MIEEQFKQLLIKDANERPDCRLKKYPAGPYGGGEPDLFGFVTGNHAISIEAKVFTLPSRADTPVRPFAGVTLRQKKVIDQINYKKGEAFVVSVGRDSDGKLIKVFILHRGNEHEVIAQCREGSPRVAHRVMDIIIREALHRADK